MMFRSLCFSVSLKSDTNASCGTFDARLAAPTASHEEAQVVPASRTIHEEPEELQWHHELVSCLLQELPEIRTQQHAVAVRIRQLKLSGFQNTVGIAPNVKTDRAGAKKSPR